MPLCGIRTAMTGQALPRINMATGILRVKHASVTNSAPTLSWGNTSTIGTVDGTSLTVKMPANPNTTPATSYATKDGIHYYKYGNVVYATFPEGSIGSNIPSNGKLADIPSGYVPARVVTVVAIDGSFNIYRINFNAGGASVTTVGKALPQGTTLRFSTCYTVS